MAKISKENKALATKIVTQKGAYYESESGHRVDLAETLGIFTTAWHETKDEATANMVERVATQLQDGSLALSDTWADDNLKPEK